MSDSNFRPDSEEAWEALLQQLRRPQAQPRPFFYARIQARLSANAHSSTTWLPAWLRRPAYALVLSTLVLAVSGDGAVAAATRSSPASSHSVPLVPR